MYYTTSQNSTLFSVVSPQKLGRSLAAQITFPQVTAASSPASATGLVSVKHASTQVGPGTVHGLSAVSQQSSEDPSWVTTTTTTTIASSECYPVPSTSKLGHSEHSTDHGPSFKFLDVENMSEIEKNSLIGRLTNDYMRIAVHYSELNQHVIRSLKDRVVTPKQLSRVLMNFSAFRVQKGNVKPLLAHHLDEIRNTEDIDDVFYILRSYGSFFDCHVLRHIVKSDLCTDDDRTELQKYEKELDVYCQRSVYECPHVANSDSQFSKFVLKVDDEVLKSFELKAVNAFRVKLAEAFDLEPHTLRLCSVEDGCIQLTFQIPHFVVDSIFPITAEQEEVLRGLGVTTLMCGESWLYNLEVPQTQKPKV